ncbi:MAG: tol-pal system protein YbgF [Rhodospirillaceae bacterium]|nr:tol-pal system protein YbgF [Rhodospirillaceae bacterium]MBT5192819.1 tol-pal system protein YbgF [Rhodospirillaceae bacterium]MBT5898510.1 tol-pal system protein YbgF [Rhodospirillaceae bacterium]MBT6428016.1 tol-pal system protein YbgF [Rhodospirillaceae bacterium]
MLAVLLTVATPAPAQNAELRTMIERLNRMESDLNVLQKDYYRGQKTGATRLTQNRPATVPAAAKDAGRLADAEIRMSNLESEMRRLTGQLEEVRHNMDTVQQRLDGFLKDMDFRLSEIDRRLSAAPAVTAAVSPPVDAGETANVSPEASTVDPQAEAATSVLPQGTPIERYNFAYALLTKMRLQDAETAFQEFLAMHGDDELAGNAQYWLGETFYARQNLPEAARAFLIGIQRYPNSNKAPDTMLKLGIALGKLGKKEDACAAFLEMQTNFTELRTQVRKRMLKEMKAGGCN